MNKKPPGFIGPGETRLADSCVAIVGLGLMGGSLAMALHGKEPAGRKCARLLGIEPDPNSLALADRLGIADSLFAEPSRALPQADLVILATPARVILSLLEKLPSLHPGSAVVLDLGSTKREIVAAMNRLPPRFDPIGGHPMCGKERSSLEFADKTLFAGSQFALVSLPQTTAHGKALVEELIQTIEARPFWLDAHTHDRWVASTSHLPYLLANSLAAITPVEAAPLIGPGYRSTSRLAVSPVNMMAEILIANSQNVLPALHAFQTQLALLESCLAQGKENELRAYLAQATHNQEAFLSREAQTTNPSHGDER